MPQHIKNKNKNKKRNCIQPLSSWVLFMPWSLHLRASFSVMLRLFPFHSFKFKLYWVMMLERKWWWQRWGISSVNDKNLERRKPKREEEGESVKICLSKSVLGYRLKAYVSLSLSMSIWDLKEKPTKRMEILSDHFNGEW